MPWKTISEALGLADGGRVRQLADNIFAVLGLDRVLATRPVGKQVAFTVALIALCAKLSKADGVTLKIEAEAFDEIYHVPESEKPNVRRLFDLAKQDVAGFEAYTQRIARLLKDEPELKRNVLRALFHVALKDRVLHKREDAFLKYVAEEFGLDNMEYRAIRALYVKDDSDPYRMLALPPDSSDQEVKAAYRRLVRQYHPDALMAAGVPSEFAILADDKIKMINAAYDEIARERGL